MVARDFILARHTAGAQISLIDYSFYYVANLLIKFLPALLSSDFLTPHPKQTNEKLSPQILWLTLHAANIQF